MEIHISQPPPPHTQAATVKEPMSAGGQLVGGQDLVLRRSGLEPKLCYYVWASMTLGKSLSSGLFFICTASLGPYKLLND